MALFYAQQFATTKLSVSGGINSSQTTGIVLQSVSGIDITKPGILCLSWSDPLNTDTYEYVSYTSISGSNELQGVTRGVEGSTGRAHDNLSDVAWVLSESHINKLNDQFETGGEGYKQISTPSSPSSGRNKLYFKSDDKLYILTSEGIESEVRGIKASASDVTTGSDDTKYVTALGIKDGRVGLNHDIKVYVTRNTNQTITSGPVETKVEFANEIYDVGSDYDNATNYRFRAPVNGYYLVSGQIYWNTGGSAGRVYVMCKKNGSIYAFQSEIYRSGGVYHSIPFIGVLNLSANDYIEIYVTQITGASLDILGGAQYTYMGINLIGV